jgi:hypothetical protein
MEHARPPAELTLEGGPKFMTGQNLFMKEFMTHTKTGENYDVTDIYTDGYRHYGMP